MHTKLLLGMLGIRHPIIEGGMAYIGDGQLAAAVSNAGGLGQVGSAGRSVDDFEKQIEIARKQTTQPLGVNLPIGEYSDPTERIEMILKYKDLFTAVSVSAGNPRPLIPIFKQAGLKVMVMVSTAMQAVKAVEAGADIIIAEGTEAGGHDGPAELGTFALIPQVASAVRVPVIAAGGIVDGRGLVAALSLGASGIQMGTRFVVTQESPAHQGYKEAIMCARGEDTVMIERSMGRVTRVLRTSYAQKVLDFEKKQPSPDEFFPYIKGEKNRIGALDGDLENGYAYSGQGCGLIQSIPSVAELMEGIVREANTIMEGLQKW